MIKDERRAEGVAWLIMAAFVYLMIVILAIAPGSETGDINLIPFRVHLIGVELWLKGNGNPWAIRDLAGNAFVFFPIGFALARGLRVLLKSRSYGRLALLIAVVASVCIETAQLFIPTRNTDVTDIIMNGIGAALGIWLASHLSPHS